MSSSEELARWKTNAWKDHDMVAWYSRQMVSSEGINTLKNAVEADILSEFVVGDDLLDVGVGTGRGSLPFARRGLRVTGVDSSAEMLEETRRLAAGIAVDLRVGDVMRLPVGEATFDTAMSLNVMVHVPQWEQALDEWLRVVRPGGRIIFDIASLDHLNAARGRNDRYQDLIAAANKAESFAGFTLALSERDIRDYAQRRGLDVLAVVPYGTLGSDSSYLPLDGHGFMRDQRWWRRLLSWVAHDEKLFTFLFWLERRLLPGLPTAFAGRFMAVLRKPAGQVGGESGVQAQASCDEWFAAHARRLGVDVATLSGELAGFMGHPRNRVVAHYLMRILEERGCLPSPESLLGAREALIYRQWREDSVRDTQAVALMENWPAVCGVPEMASDHGVDIADAFIYDTLPELLRLARGFGQGGAQ